ncbi:hypothetical protein QN277_023731 [Acacia crassicarpa]|uniref:Knottins-like domain-containing protein n=1 Tax=Acacia crassicarpa TaxID=499986 RepID=A0AAE1JD73_9FABA|nr:hypothetical protein QN277_023731 [Acacia crassicarpa]
MERKSLVVVFSILILLLAAQEVVVKAEAQTCEKPSKFFKGPCFSETGDPRCDVRCRRDEGLLSGFCKGLKCVCTYAC